MSNRFFLNVAIGWWRNISETTLLQSIRLEKKRLQGNLQKEDQKEMMSSLLKLRYYWEIWKKSNSRSFHLKKYFIVLRTKNIAFDFKEQGLHFKVSLDGNNKWQSSNIPQHFQKLELFVNTTLFLINVNGKMFFWLKRESSRML